MLKIFVVHAFAIVSQTMPIESVNWQKLILLNRTGWNLRLFLFIVHIQFVIKHRRILIVDIIEKLTEAIALMIKCVCIYFYICSSNFVP